MVLLVFFVVGMVVVFAVGILKDVVVDEVNTRRHKANRSTPVAKTNSIRSNNQYKTSANRDMNIFKRGANIFKQSSFVKDLDKQYRMMFLTGQIEYSVKLTAPTANKEQGTANLFVEIQNDSYLSQPMLYEFAMIFVQNQALSRQLYELRFEKIFVGGASHDKVMEFDLIL